jgi:hypothetical protein
MISVSRSKTKVDKTRCREVLVDELGPLANLPEMEMGSDMDEEGSDTAMFDSTAMMESVYEENKQKGQKVSVCEKDLALL